MALFDLLLVPVFSLHLVAVHVAAAGPLLCIALEWRATHHNDFRTGNIGHRLGALSLAMLLIGLALGGVLFVLLWSS